MNLRKTFLEVLVINIGMKKTPVNVDIVFVAKFC